MTPDKPMPNSDDIQMLLATLDKDAEDRDCPYFCRDTMKRAAAALRAASPPPPQPSDADLCAELNYIAGYAGNTPEARKIAEAAARIEALAAQVMVKEKLAQGYYNEASDGWTKFRRAGAEIARLKACVRSADALAAQIKLRRQIDNYPKAHIESVREIYRELDKCQDAYDAARRALDAKENP